MELVTCHDARDVQEGGFSRIVSLAMMHNNEEALEEDDGNPFILVNVIMMCSCYMMESQVVGGGSYVLGSYVSIVLLLTGWTASKHVLYNHVASNQHIQYTMKYS